MVLVTFIFKSKGVTPEFIKSFQAIEYKNTSFTDSMMDRSRGITVALIKQYNAVGFSSVITFELSAAKTIGVTPDYISSKKQKGFNFTSLDKYIQLKHLSSN